MHSMGLHSALAIKRQRKRRADQKRARERRFSIQSTESGLGGSHSSCASPRNSIDGAEHGHRFRKKQGKSTVNGFDSNVGIGMLHVGVVFVVLGIFLLGSGLIPNDLDTWRWQNIFTKAVWWNELVITGAFSLLLGVFLIGLDKFISRREEEDLNDYVQRQLTRSRSGHRLVRDVETGNLTTKRSKSATTPICDDFRKDMVEEIPIVHSPKVKSPPANYVGPNHIFMNGEVGLVSPQLEKIMEEDVSVSERGVDADVNANQEDYDSTTASVSPGSPSETQELLNGAMGGYAVSVPVPSKYHQVRMSKI